MRRTSGGTRVGGSWLAIASSLIIATLVLHGPIAPDLSEQMRRIADGKAHGFAFLALAVAVIAGNDARRADGVTPPAAAWAAVIAGGASFTGWGLSMWFGIAPANLLWVAASILMSAWTIWFGVALAREPMVSMENAEAR